MVRELSSAQIRAHRMYITQRQAERKAQERAYMHQALTCLFEAMDKDKNMLETLKRWLAEGMGDNDAMVNYLVRAIMPCASSSDEDESAEDESDEDESDESEKDEPGKDESAKDESDESVKDEPAKDESDEDEPDESPNKRQRVA